MDYNKGFKYNVHINENGLGYNSVTFRIVIKVYESINARDDVRNAFAFIAMLERVKFNETLVQFVFHHKIDEFYFKDKQENLVLFKLAEKLKISDSLSNILVALYLNDNINVLDEVSELNSIISTDEKFFLYDILNLDALISISEKYNLNEASNLFTLIKEYENAILLDREPRKAISDFVIGKVSGFDSAFDWIVPFEMMIDWKSSSIQIMPQSESNYIEMPGVDGSTPEYTVYKNRVFNIVAFSKDGLTQYEKEELKKDIVRILDSTKNDTKRLTFLSPSTSFDVKYSGAAEIGEGPSFIKATIPLEASPYGSPLFLNEVYGSGLIVNDGQASAGPINYISEGAVNPSFQIANRIFSWEGTVPTGSRLVINHEAYMCYLENNFGDRTNAITALTGDFYQIPKESSAVITAFGDTEQYLYTTLKERILW